MPDLSEVTVPRETMLRSSTWWLGIAVGILFGRSLMLFLSDARDWSHFRIHVVAEIVCVAIPFFLALLSPHRVAAVLIGLCMVPISFVMLIIIFHNAWSIVATLIWLLSVARLAGATSRRYKFEDPLSMFTGVTALGVLLFVAGVGGGFYSLHLLRSSLSVAY